MGRKATTILTCLSLELEAAVFVLQEQGGGKEGRRVFVKEQNDSVLWRFFKKKKLTRAF
jgi:hypothetical protein